MTNAQLAQITQDTIAYAKEMKRNAKIAGTPEHAKVQALAAQRANDAGYLAAIARRYR